MHFRAWAPADLDSHPVVCLPRLRKLNLGWPEYTSRVVNPLKNLELPALEELHLLVSETVTITVMNQILRSTPHLLGLCIDSELTRFPYSGGESENVEPLWSCVPMLEELALTYATERTWDITPQRIHRLWIEKLLASHWLCLHKPSENFRPLKLYQESSKTDKDYVTLQDVIDEHMKVRERSYSICLQENWALSQLNNLKISYWPHN